MRASKVLAFLLPGIAFGQKCSIPGECTGFSIETDRFDSEKECISHCKSVDGCEWYTYDTSNGFCNVLQDCTEIDSTCITCFSGENECGTELMCFVTGECSGAFLDHITATSPEKCLRQCQEGYPSCKYFSFHYDGNICNFYETCALDETASDVVSGERDCNNGSGQAHTKIFIQFPNVTSWIHMPSIYQNGNGRNCNQPWEYPVHSVQGAVAQVINDSITLCGGSSNFKECYSLNAALNVWVEFPSMDVGREYAASAMTSAGWWITGGQNVDTFSSTSLWDGSSWQAGTELPRKRYGHCMVQVNSSHTFMAGGHNYPDFLSDAYFFDWSAKVWITLPSMAKGLVHLACTLYQDSHGGEHIIIAGGTGGSLRLVQSLNLSNPTKWETLPDLLTDVDGATFVHDGEDLIIVNPNIMPGSDNLLRFDESTLTFNAINGQNVTLGSYGVVILVINDAALNGCN